MISVAHVLLNRRRINFLLQVLPHHEPRSRWLSSQRCLPVWTCGQKKAKKNHHHASDDKHHHASDDECVTTVKEEGVCVTENLKIKANRLLAVRACGRTNKAKHTVTSDDVCIKNQGRSEQKFFHARAQTGKAKHHMPHVCMHVCMYDEQYHCQGKAMQQY